MTNLFKKYETSSTKETEGVDIIIDGATFVCRRAGGSNRRYLMAIGHELAVPGVREKLNSGDELEAADVDDAVSMKVFSEVVVIGWRDVLDRNDQLWEYTTANFVELMKACPDVWFQLRAACRDLDNFRVQQAQAVGEELGKS